MCLRPARPMLVHEEKDESFADKNPYIAQIKDAHHAKLTGDWRLIVKSETAKILVTVRGFN